MRFAVDTVGPGGYFFEAFAKRFLRLSVAIPGDHSIFCWLGGAFGVAELALKVAFVLL